MKSLPQLFLLSLLAVTNAYRLGAPIESCALLYPIGHNYVVRNSSATASLDLNISAFTNGSYIPGNVYTLILESTVIYRGFLVQGRLKADERTPVGKFSIANGVRLMDCHALPNSTVTHTNNTGKKNVILNWTAPSSGTGPVIFLFTVVVTYDRKESLNIFYANRKTVPLTERIVAPPQHGNGTSQLTNGTSLWTNGTSERGNGTNYTLTSIIISDSTNAPPVSDTDAGASPLLNPATTIISLLSATTMVIFLRGI